MRRLLALSKVIAAGMIHVLARHCHSQNTKNRPRWFQKEDVFQNLLATMDKQCSLTVLFDGDPIGHFVMKYPVSIVKFEANSDAGSFRKTLQFAEAKQGYWDAADVIYLVEDDFCHRPGWPAVLREGIEHADLVSLFDHNDKYFDPSATCHLTFTRSCHWRTAVSTTNTFAVKFSQLLEDMPTYKRFCNPMFTRVCIDHERFLELKETKNRQLITSVPGYSTHCESEYLSPVIDWSEAVKYR